MPQVMAIENVIGLSFEDKVSGGRIWMSIVDEKMLPAICLCVSKWELFGFPETVTPDNFPATPRPESHKLIKWLFDEIYKVYLGELEIPNE